MKLLSLVLGSNVFVECLMNEPKEDAHEATYTLSAPDPVFKDPVLKDIVFLKHTKLYQIIHPA